MDPNTTVALLALNLLCVGGLLHLIAGRMPDPAGLRDFGTGALVFGFSYLLRLQLGLGSGAAVGLLPDVGMIFATLSFANGLRQFTGRATMGRSRLLAVVAVYAVVALGALLMAGGVGRHVVLNLALGLGYGLLGLVALRAARREVPLLRTPLRLLAGLVGVLGLVTAARGLVVLTQGLAAVFEGTLAQAYYGYSVAVTVLLCPTLLWMVFLRLNMRLGELATHDALTGALNRRGLDEGLLRLHAQRPAPPLVAMLVDIDHFKQVNDQQGHATGDGVLRDIAKTLAEGVRGGDLVARWGGEEFLVVGQAGEPGAVQALAERLRARVQAAGLGDQGTLRCTVSIGVSAPFVGPEAWAAALRAADAALYAAKHAGRNRVVFAPNPSAG